LGARVDENRQEIQARLSELENIRILFGRGKVSRQGNGSLEGDRVEVPIRATLREVNQQIFELRASQG
jgi:hypothetical protein